MLPMVICTEYLSLMFSLFLNLQNQVITTYMKKNSKSTKQNSFKGNNVDSHIMALTKELIATFANTLLAPHKPENGRIRQKFNIKFIGKLL